MSINTTDFRLPHVLICGSDVTSDNSVLPLWEQVTIVLAKTYPNDLQIDVFARLAPHRDITSLKEKLSRVSQEINCDSLTTNIRADHIPLKPYHTHIIFCGLRPHRRTPSDVTAIYIPTQCFPPHAEFPFDRLGYKGFVVMRENEARKLLDELDPERTAGSAIATLRARALVRALVAQPSLEILQGIVIARGQYGLDGCVSSAKILVPAPFDDDDDVDADDTEERYEFDIPKPIIEDSQLEVRGAYGAFVGKFIASLILASSGAPPIDVYSETQFSFQLEMACVAAATTAMTHAASPMDLADRIPTLPLLAKNITQYTYCRPMLRQDEDPPSTGDHPVKVRISWPAPAHSPPPSPIVAAALAKHHGVFRGFVRCTTDRY